MIVFHWFSHAFLSFLLFPFPTESATPNPEQPKKTVLESVLPCPVSVIRPSRVCHPTTREANGGWYVCFVLAIVYARLAAAYWCVCVGHDFTAFGYVRAWWDFSVSRTRVGADQTEESESQESSEMESEEEEDYQWIPWFCSLKGNEFFSQIDADFIQDAFNLTGTLTARVGCMRPTHLSASCRRTL
jgi:hypothetical protein